MIENNKYPKSLLKGYLNVRPLVARKYQFLHTNICFVLHLINVPSTHYHILKPFMIDSNIKFYNLTVLRIENLKYKHVIILCLLYNMIHAIIK